MPPRRSLTRAGSGSRRGFRTLGQTNRALLQGLTQAPTERFAGPRAADIAPRETRAGVRVTGIARQLSGQAGILRAGGRGVDPQNLAFEAERVGAVERDLFQNVTDLLLSQQQQRQLRGITSSAAAGGIRGGALAGALQRTSQQFLAENRATGFRNAARRADEVEQDLLGSARGLLQQLGTLQSFGDIGARGQAAVGGVGADQFRQFARPLVDALVGLGQERALTAGLLLQENVSLEQFDLSAKENQLAQAVNTFLNPRITQEQRQQIGRQSGLRGVQFRQSSRRLAQGAAIGETRLAAAGQISSILSQPLQAFRGAAQRLRTDSLAAQTFLANRFASGLTNLDTSSLQPTFRALGGGFRRI